MYKKKLYIKSSFLLNARLKQIEKYLIIKIC